MPLTPGSRFGSFEVSSPLGVGGMGEVYRARDTRLDRPVAIKVLLDSFASDPDRLARFEREAKLLASLNHPHIAQIYGVEESGGTRALVMEFVDGGTLADRISWGPVPLDEVLPIARQIADALEAAHAKGIVHRDLKPANVKLAADGTVKVLDFGFAKALDASNSSGGGAAAVSMSPTMMSPDMTRAGVILGTAAYMSPEQAKGRDVDERRHLGVRRRVLGDVERALALCTRVDVRDARGPAQKEPAWDRVPRSLRSLLEMCLAKDVKQRLRNAGDVRLLLDQQLDEDVTRPVMAPPARRSARWPIVTAAAALAATLILVFAWSKRDDGAPALPEVTRLELALPPGVELFGSTSRSVASSPDGRRVALWALPAATGRSSCGGSTGSRRLQSRAPRVQRLRSSRRMRAPSASRPPPVSFGSPRSSTGWSRPPSAAPAFSMARRGRETISSFTCMKARCGRCLVRAVSPSD